MTDTELDRLVRWYAVEWLGEADGVRDIHSGVGPDGAPAWSDPFRHYILDPSDATFEDSHYYTKPLHAALLAVAKQNHRHYRYLTMLRSCWDRDLMPEAFSLAALRHLRRVYRLRAP